MFQMFIHFNYRRVKILIKSLDWDEKRGSFCKNATAVCNLFSTTLGSYWTKFNSKFQNSSYLNEDNFVASTFLQICHVIHRYRYLRRKFRQKIDIRKGRKAVTRDTSNNFLIHFFQFFKLWKNLQSEVSWEVFADFVSFQTSKRVKVNSFLIVLWLWKTKSNK